MTAHRSIAIVYASVHHGNTPQLAEALSAELSTDRFTVEEAQRGSAATEVEESGVGLREAGGVLGPSPSEDRHRETVDHTA